MTRGFNGATAGAGPTGAEGLEEAETQGGSNKEAIANAKGSSTDGLWNAFSRGFAPSIVEFRERGERGTYLDGLIGAGKEAWNTGAGLVDTARMLQDPAGFALGFHAPSPRWEVGDRELGGAAIMNGATMLVPVRLGGHFAVVARNALVSERVAVGAARAGGGLADDAARTVPMGSSRSPMTILGQQNVPTNIGGRQYTGHALDSMQSRGITPSVVEDTLAGGVRTPGHNGAMIFSTNQARVIVNPNGSIKTVYGQ